MKCPKCQYLSFGSGSRCRNCGYDFSLSLPAATSATGAEASAELDLPIEVATRPVGPLVDLPLGDRLLDEDDSASRWADSRTRPAREAAEHLRLPLFTSDSIDDAPLVSVPAIPRAPLAVRRPAPPPPRPKADGDLSGDQGTARGRNRAGEDRQAAIAGGASEQETGAPVLSRILGGVVDFLILGAIDAAVIYLTLRVTGLQVSDLSVLPKIPLAAFVLLLNGGYLVLFTAAGGQTIGKMATGIRVVPQQPEAGPRVPFGTAVVRAAGCVVSLLPAGLGFAPILFSQNGRALHDRLSDTRVVKA